MAGGGMSMEYDMFLVEVSEWFDWFKKCTNRRSKPQLTDELIVLLAVRAVQYANELEPKYYGRLPKRTRNRLIKASVIDQYCQLVNGLRVEGMPSYG
jgi:hypothetical protein